MLSIIRVLLASDAYRRNQIIQRHIPSALEECGLMDELIEAVAALGFDNRVGDLNSARATYMEDIRTLNQKIDSLVTDMNSLQLK